MSTNNAVSGDAHWTRRYPDRVPRGERHPRAALRGLMRRTALEMVAAGHSIRHVARELGVSRKAVANATRTAVPSVLEVERASEVPRAGTHASARVGRAEEIGGESEKKSPFRITEHAIDRYIERIRPGIPRARALRELCAITRGAHAVKEIEPGLWLWRGPKPRRLRLRVSTREPGPPQLVTVLTAHDGMKGHIR